MSDEEPQYCIDDEQEKPLTKEDLLMSESDILAGLLELGSEKNDESSYHKIQIRRDGVLKLEFRIRPLDENENQSCYRRATKYAKTKAGQPKVAIETNQAYYRSCLIYTATVDEDRAKTWDNRQAKDRLNVLDSVEMVDKVLKQGEKDRVIDILNDICGYEEDAEKLAQD